METSSPAPWNRRTPRLPAIVATLAFALVVPAVYAAGEQAVAAAERVAAPEVSPEAAARVDALFAEWDRPDTPGCTVGVARDGELLYARGYGMADLDNGVPNRPGTIYPIGSNSKQFTAMSAALLIEAGKLSLDDDIRRYLPEMPQYEWPITVRDLVYHTNGLRDYNALRFLAGVPPNQVEIGETYALLTRQKALAFQPGTSFDYSNSGYVLLRLIVERVSGESLARFAAEHIFQPLGMTHSRISEDFAAVLPGRASVYDGDSTTGFRQVNAPPLAGSGGVWTTVADLALWEHNFSYNRLGKGGPGLIALAMTPDNRGKEGPGDYVFGQFLGQYAGHPIAWHAGRGPGYVADLVRFLDRDLAVFCLCNAVIDSRALSRRVADVFLPPAEGGEAAAPAPAPPSAAAAAKPAAAPPAPSATELAAVAGYYRDPKSGEIWCFAVEDGILALHLGNLRLEMGPAATGGFHTVRPDWGWEVRFEKAADGGRGAAVFGKGGVEKARYLPLPDHLAGADAAPYLGRFANDELDATYRMEVAGDRLELFNRVGPKGALLPLGADRFVLPTDWYDLYFQFERDPGGRVVGFTLDSDAASGLRFTRLGDCPPATR